MATTSRATTIRVAATAASPSSTTACRSVKGCRGATSGGLVSRKRIRARRPRVEKKERSAAVSDAVKPIQYWVDSGAPEDVKKALVEGASWWSQAFEAAGFRNGFKVDVLPAGADP